jgi:hypothetical protein
MRCDDLDVLDGAATISALVLEPRIRELNMPVVIRELVFLSPTSHGLCAFFRGLTSIAAPAVLALQEPLILALQLFFENDTAHRLAALGQSLCGFHVCAVNLGIVGQLTTLGDADVERLTISGAGPSPSLEHVTSVAGECHQGRPRSPDDVRSRPHEAKVT